MPSDTDGGKPADTASTGNLTSSRDSGTVNASSRNTNTPVIDNLLKRITPDRNAFRGTWHFDGDTLVSPATPFALLQVPVAPPESYVLRATVETAEIKDCLVCWGLVVANTQATIVLNGWRNTISGLQLIDRQMIPTNATKTGPVLKAGTPNEITCTVTAGRIEATCNGKQFLNWTGDFNRLRGGPDWGPPNKRQLYLGSYLTSYRISKLELEPLSPASATTGGTRSPPSTESPSRGPKPNASPRQIVERVLQLDGIPFVKAAASPGPVAVKALAEVPADGFEIVNVVLRRGTPADLEFICSVPLGGNGLTLMGRDFGDNHLAALTGAKSIGEFRLDGTSCTDAGLAHLARVDRLVQLPRVGKWKIQRGGLEASAVDLRPEHGAGHRR